MQLRGDRLAQERGQLLGIERRREARRAAVSAAALGARDGRHVDVVVGRAQRDFVLALALAARELAHEHGDLRALERAQLVDDALRVALLGVRAIEVLRAQRRDRELPVVEALQLREREREQRELAQRHALIEPAVDAGHVDARLDQLGGHEVRTRPRVLVHEAAGVGDQPDVQGLGDRRRGAHVEPVHQVPHDLRRARGVGHDVVERAEARVVVVMVDVQQVRAVAQHACGVAVDVAAVEEHHRALRDVRRRQPDEAVEREEAVLARQRQIVRRDEHRRVLAQRLQQPVHPHQRAERVAVGILVRGEHEALVLADAREHQLARLRDGRGLAHRGALAHRLSPSSSWPSPSAGCAGGCATSSSTRSARSVVSS